MPKSFYKWGGLIVALIGALGLAGLTDVHPVINAIMVVYGPALMWTGKDA